MQKLLPDWADSAMGSPAGMLELKSFAAKHLGLRVAEDGRLTARALPAARFKTSLGTQTSEISAARSIATTCARIVARATVPPVAKIDADPSVFRKRALEYARHGWIDFEALLEVCWHQGIPVLYLPELPAAGKKMEGMVTYVANRPVIILTKKAQYADWSLFILAHEIGHIGKGHLGSVEGDAVVDETVAEEAGSDAQEIEANKFAACVLTQEGKPLTLKTLVSASVLAREALIYGKAKEISPGHVILNAVRHTTIGGKHPYALGNAALRELSSELDASTVAELCKSALRRFIDTSILKDESLDFLEKLAVL